MIRRILGDGGQGSRSNYVSSPTDLSIWFSVTEMASTFNPRECKLSKQEGQSYGFFLRIEKDTDGHLVRAIEKGSPAEEAGLQDGDRVLRINGVFVDKEEHAQVNGSPVVLPPGPAPPHIAAHHSGAGGAFLAAAGQAGRLRGCAFCQLIKSPTLTHAR